MEAESITNLNFIDELLLTQWIAIVKCACHVRYLIPVVPCLNEKIGMIMFHHLEGGFTQIKFCSRLD